MDYRIACIGAGTAGTGHMIGFEKLRPGCCVAFSDISRSRFDSIVSARLGPDNQTADSPTEPFTLRSSFRDLAYYPDPEEMLDKENVDIVIIGSYCSHHAEAVELCVKKGVHILLEKPIAISESDIRKVWELLRDYPGTVSVNFSLRGSALTESARKHIQNGAIGRVISVQFINNVHYGDNYFRGWMRTSADVGSLLLQKATHDLDLMSYLTGLHPKAVAAFGSRQVYGGDKPNDLTCHNCPEKWTCRMSIYRRKIDSSRPVSSRSKALCVFAEEIDIDDNHVLAIQYEGGMTGSYSQTFNAPSNGGQRGGYIIGEEGILELRFYNGFQEHHETGAYISGKSLLRLTRFDAMPGYEILEHHDWAGLSHFGSGTNLSEGFLRLLAGEPSPMNASIRDGYVSAMTCIAAQKSIDEGRVVQIPL